MDSHIALIRLLEKIKTNSFMQMDLICSLLETNQFETWSQIEEVFFTQGFFDHANKDNLRIQWIREIEKVSADKDSGINFVCWGDTNYPVAFQKLINPPLLFSYIGKNCWQNNPCFSVVGSREPHSYTSAWMKTELRSFIKESNLTVVSGGARGVDFMAHSLCLDLGKPTLVMLPSGLKQIYPPPLKNYLKAIVDAGGCVLSEYDSNLEVRKHLFQHRNRLIAAMNHALLIGEAKLQSGTMMTAHLALEIGRPVWVVPGHPLMSSFAGSLELIMYGAQIVRNAEDLKLFFECELYTNPLFNPQN
ncbi:MAG: DNA-processing protein DprA [Bdellovibrionota bacterium]